MENLLEPYMIKAFRLLHSKDKDSGDQLKQMLDEAIRQRNESQSQDNKLPKALTMIKKEVKKVKMDIVSDIEDVPLSKRQKESPRTSQPSSPSTRSPQHSRSVSPSVSAAQKSEDSNSLIDADDLAQEIMDLHCVVCTGLDVTSGNQLVECHECRGLYHQECHRPSISDAEANDPRLVWLCSNCNKNVKSNKNATSANRPKSGSNRESPVTFRNRSDSPSLISGSKGSLFKTGSSTVKPIATKSAPSSSSSSTSSSSTASGTVNSSLMNADKRLQIIKKRAATKLQEKRKPAK